MIQARGQLSRHHSGPCPRDDAEEALQILRWASRLSCQFCFVTLVPGFSDGIRFAAGFLVAEATRNVAEVAES